MHHYTIWMQILFILTLPVWTPNTAFGKISGNRSCEINKTMNPVTIIHPLQLIKPWGES